MDGRATHSAVHWKETSRYRPVPVLLPWRRAEGCKGLGRAMGLHTIYEVNGNPAFEMLQGAGEGDGTAYH
jgi:hypothetical protein